MLQLEIAFWLLMILSYLADWLGAPAWLTLAATAGALLAALAVFSPWLVLCWRELRLAGFWARVWGRE